MHHEEPVAELLRASWKLPPRLTPALMIRLPAIASFPPLKIRELSSFSYSYSCHLFIVCLTRFLLIIPMRSYPHLPSRNGREDFVFLVFVFFCEVLPSPCPLAMAEGILLSSPALRMALLYHLPPRNANCTVTRVLLPRPVCLACPAALLLCHLLC